MPIAQSRTHAASSEMKKLAIHAGFRALLRCYFRGLNDGEAQPPTMGHWRFDSRDSCNYSEVLLSRRPPSFRRPPCEEQQLYSSFWVW